MDGLQLNQHPVTYCFDWITYTFLGIRSLRGPAKFDILNHIKVILILELYC